jgi:glycosyltransferase involved in cell wall biosynthesis
MFAKALPKITVVTPSYQQATFLEKALRSVLDQGYPNLEYFVVDGGSTDGSVDIIRRHASSLAWWISEKDRGQSHAINKGFARATGDILCWLNSDDYLAPGALHQVASVLGAAQVPRAVVGDCIRVFEDGRQPFRHCGDAATLGDLLEYWQPYPMHQPSIFWTRPVYERVGPVREDLHLIMDFDYWLRIAAVCSFEYVPEVLSYAHYHAAAKTADEFREYTRQRERYARARWPALPLGLQLRLRTKEAVVLARRTAGRLLRRR